MGGGFRVPIYFYKNPYIDVEGEFVEGSPSLTAGSQKMLTGGDSMKLWKFEEEFPLPWDIERRDTAARIRPVAMPKQDSIFVDTNIDAHMGAVCYAVACANLMPHIIDKLDEMDACGLVDEIINGIEDAGVIGGREVAE